MCELYDPSGKAAFAHARPVLDPVAWGARLGQMLRGQLDDTAVRHAIQLSEDKYCSVAAMLRKTAALSWHYEILAPAT